MSIVPSTDPCQAGGGGWVTAVNPETGAFTQAFKNSNASGGYVGGVTPRGLFVVSKAATAASSGNPATPGADYLYVTRNFTSGASNSGDSAVSPIFNEKAGGTTEGGDGSGTTSLGTEIPCTGPGCTAPVTSFGTRRQVWRQIQ